MQAGPSQMKLHIVGVCLEISIILSLGVVEDLEAMQLYT